MHIKDTRTKKIRLKNLIEGDVFQFETQYDNNFIYIVTQKNTIVNLVSGWECNIDSTNAHLGVTKLNVELVIND